MHCLYFKPPCFNKVRCNLGSNNYGSSNNTDKKKSSKPDFQPKSFIQMFGKVITVGTKQMVK